MPGLKLRRRHLRWSTPAPRQLRRARSFLWPVVSTAVGSEQDRPEGITASCIAMNFRPARTASAGLVPVAPQIMGHLPRERPEYCIYRPSVTARPRHWRAGIDRCRRGGSERPRCDLAKQRRLRLVRGRMRRVSGGRRRRRRLIATTALPERRIAVVGLCLPATVDWPADQVAPLHPAHVELQVKICQLLFLNMREGIAWHPPACTPQPDLISPENT